MRNYRNAVFLKCIYLFLVFSMVVCGKVRIGGHAAVTIFDASAGISTIKKPANKDYLVVQDTSSDYSGFKFLKLVMFIRAGLSEKLFVDIRPVLHVNGLDGTTGATPRFNNKIGDQRAKTAALELDGFTRAVVKAVLPSTTEISIGYLHPKFTWEYGSELFWEDEMNGSVFAINPWLGEMSDVGLEIIHYFDIGEAFTLPTYLYVMNGSLYEENNLSPFTMLHVEPEIYPVKFHLTGGIGVWDKKQENLVCRSSAGIQFALGKFLFRSEFAMGIWKKHILNSTDDALTHGAYGKMFFRINRKIRTSVGVAYAYHNFIHIFEPLPGEEMYFSITPGLQITTSPKSRLCLQVDINNWQQNPWDVLLDYDKKLQFLRTTLGWRLTF